MRRRKRKFTWLPTIGTNSAFEGGGASTFQVTEIQVPPVPNGDFIGDAENVVFPLVNDEPQEFLQGSTEEGIGEIIGNEYVIERIVGKLFLGFQGGVATSGNASVIVKAGIFVARAEGGGSASQSSPIGLGPFNYSPLVLQTVREPWMWLRTWVLSSSSAQVTNPFSRGSATFGRTNFGLDAGASVFEGPHIDVKSVRRVRQDERLFMTIGAVGLNPRADATTSTGGTVDAVLDIRVLGALRKARNHGSF